MSALAKIKKAAAQHEQDRQYDKALAQYARLLDGGAGSDEEVDVTLYNRAGDLALRAGDVPRAVTYFERAIDLYAAGGFLNNAVALAVKILRHAPGHLAAHHTLGVLYGRKGFRAEARQHLADYAAQMHRAGRADEVRRTLAELAALGAAPDEVASVRELLTARAAGPDDAGALVRAYDAALGPVGQEVAAAHVPAPETALPLSELIEFEVRGPRFAPITAEAAAAAVRWTTALPGDPAPLRVSALRAPIPDLELLDLGAVEPAPADDDASASELLDVGTFDVAAFETPSFEIPSFDGSTYEVPAFEVPTFERSAVDAPDFDAPSARDDRFEGESPESGLPEFVAFGEPVDDDVAHADSANTGLLDAARWLPEVDAPVASAPPASSAEGRTVPADEPTDEPTDLGEWLRSTDVPSSTRLVTPAPRESGDENADFDAALHAFTAGIAQSVDASDRESHYDLGVAFREMGLLPDAVREFQRALSAPGSGLREREALAQCFLDLDRPELALATLEQVAAAAFASGTAGDTLVGVHYVLAEAARAVGRTDDARAWYVRVLATDYEFRDAATRLAALPPPSPFARR